MLSVADLSLYIHHQTTYVVAGDGLLSLHVRLMLGGYDQSGSSPVRVCLQSLRREGRVRKKRCRGSWLGNSRITTCTGRESLWGRKWKKDIQFWLVKVNLFSCMSTLIRPSDQPHWPPTKRSTSSRDRITKPWNDRTTIIYMKAVHSLRHNGL
jgi:hypothetical protein